MENKFGIVPSGLVLPIADGLEPIDLKRPSDTRKFGIDSTGLVQSMREGLTPIDLRRFTDD